MSFEGGVWKFVPTHSQLHECLELSTGNEADRYAEVRQSIEAMIAHVVSIVNNPKSIKREPITATFPREIDALLALELIQKIPGWPKDCAVLSRCNFGDYKMTLQPFWWDKPSDK